MVNVLLVDPGGLLLSTALVASGLSDFVGEDVRALARSRFTLFIRPAALGWSPWVLYQLLHVKIELDRLTYCLLLAILAAILAELLFIAPLVHVFIREVFLLFLHNLIDLVVTLRAKTRSSTARSDPIGNLTVLVGGTLHEVL